MRPRRTRSPEREIAIRRTSSQSTSRRGVVTWGRRRTRADSTAPAPTAPMGRVRRTTSARVAGLMLRSYGWVAADPRVHRGACPPVDVDGVLGGLAQEPVGVEPLIGPAAFAQEGLVEYLLSGQRWRLGADDLPHRVAEDLGRPPLTRVAEAPVDARQALDDGHGPERVACDPVGRML